MGFATGRKGVTSPAWTGSRAKPRGSSLGHTLPSLRHFYLNTELFPQITLFIFLFWLLGNSKPHWKLSYSIVAEPGQRAAFPLHGAWLFTNVFQFLFIEFGERGRRKGGVSGPHFNQLSCPARAPLIFLTALALPPNFHLNSSLVHMFICSFFHKASQLLHAIK